MQQQISPVEWLQGQIIVSFPGDAEILEISMRGENPEALQKLVNAVCNAYVEKGWRTREPEIQRPAEHKTNLERWHLNPGKAAAKTGAAQYAGRFAGTGNTQAANQKEQIARKITPRCGASKSTRKWRAVESASKTQNRKAARCQFRPGDDPSGCGRGGKSQRTRNTTRRP